MVNNFLKNILLLSGLFWASFVKIACIVTQCALITVQYISGSQNTIQTQNRNNIISSDQYICIPFRILATTYCIRGFNRRGLTKTVLSAFFVWVVIHLIAIGCTSSETWPLFKMSRRKNLTRRGTPQCPPYHLWCQNVLNDAISVIPLIC